MGHGLHAIFLGHNGLQLQQEFSLVHNPLHIEAGQYKNLEILANQLRYKIIAIHACISQCDLIHHNPCIHVI